MTKIVTNQLGYTYDQDNTECESWFDVPYKKCALLWSHVANEPGGTCRTCCIAKHRIKDDKDYARMYIIAGILLYSTLFSFTYFMYKLSSGVCSFAIPYFYSGEILT